MYFDELKRFEYGLTDRTLLWKDDDYPAGTDEHPVTYVMPGDAADFCTWLTKQHPRLGLFRLPTWNEWMIAAYGRSRDYAWGNDWNRTKLCSSHGRNHDEKRVRPEPVKAVAGDRTPEGVYGLMGNVAELLVRGDAQDKEYFLLGTRWMGTAYDDGDHFRWEPKDADIPIPPREDYFGYYHGAQATQTIGFRVVLDPTNDPKLIQRPRVFGQQNENWRLDRDEQGRPVPPKPIGTFPAGDTDKTPARPGR